MTSIVDRLIKGSAWLAGARLLTNALAFVSTFVMARLLNPDDFGLVAIGTSVQVIALAVTELSLSQALIQHRDPRVEHYHTVWTLGVGRGAALALLICLLAVPLSRFYDDPRLADVIYVLALTIFISGLSNPRQAMLERDLIFWQQFVLSVSGKMVAIVVSIAVALIWRSYWALIVGVLASQVVNTLLSYLLIPFRPRFSVTHLGELWAFSIWLSLGKVVNTINWRFDQLLVGNILGPAILGLYSVGSNLAQLPTREALAPLNVTLFPALSRIAHDPSRLYKGYQRAQSVLVFAALPLGLSLALVADPLIILAMGEKWAGAVPVVQVLTVVFALQTFGSMVQPLGMATGNTRVLFWRDLQMFGVRLPIIIVGTLVWGLPGLVIGRVVSGLIAAGVNMVLVRRILDLPLRSQFKVNLRSLTGACAMGIGTVLLQWVVLYTATPTAWDRLFQIGASLAAGWAIYLGTVFGLWLLFGRPEGAENEALKLGGKLRDKLAARRA